MDNFSKTIKITGVFCCTKDPMAKYILKFTSTMKLYGLPRKKMAELFDVNVPAISKHLQNIYNEGGLQKKATVSKMEIVQKERNRNVTRTREFYNLDAIIAVGYRVNSKRATHFRI